MKKQNMIAKITVTMTPVERGQLEAIARDRRMTVSALVRDMLYTYRVVNCNDKYAIQEDAK